MTSNRPQNSILVLATLGVYLGLVLAGGSIQVRAQTSETLLNSVQDACTVPSRDKLLEDAYRLTREIGPAGLRKTLITSEIADLFDDLLDDLKQDRHNLKNEFIADFVVHQVAPLDVQITSRIRNNFRYSGTDRTKSDFLGEKLYSYLEKIAQISCERSTLNCSDVSLKVAFDEAGFVAETRFDFPQKSAANASLFARSYNLENEYDGCSKSDYVDKAIFDNTRARAENHQVLIVTRLPRAGLDALLANNTK